MSNEDLIFFYCFLSLIAAWRLSTRQRRIADFDATTDAKAVVCSNGGRILFDGVLQLDDLLRREAFKGSRAA